MLLPTAAAHPRSRGENIARAPAFVNTRGSSPLTRGKQRRLARPRHPHRLIPAHAGKTTRPSGGAQVSWAHPRSRGENVTAAKPQKGGAGSSPLTRGKLDHLPRHRRKRRLIPAHAGKTSPDRGRPRWCAAHPRSRGENFQSWVCSFPAPGSSPLTRGKRKSRTAWDPPVRLIPAHAGKTHAVARCSDSWSAHPRSRGENFPDLDVATAVAGSSPLTRGKPDLRGDRLHH